MLKRYNIKLKLQYKFDLDGKSKEDIAEQVDFIMANPHILTLPEVNKIKKLKIKEIKRRKKNDQTDN